MAEEKTGRGEMGREGERRRVEKVRVEVRR